MDFYIESNIYGHYLVFDGDENVYAQVLQKLQKLSA